MPTSLLAVLALSATVQAQADAPKPIYLKDARVVVRPGVVMESACILIKDGKIAAVAPNLTPPEGAEVINCAGLTAYPGLIHPFYRVSVTGVSAAPPTGGPGQRPQQTSAQLAEAQKKRDADPFGREVNLLAKRTKDLKQADATGFGSLAKSGYGLAQISASGGLVGSAGAVYSLGGKDLDPAAVVSSPEFIPLNFSSRGFGGVYPSSTMGAIAFIRQALYDAQRYGRLAKTDHKLKTDPELELLEPVAYGRTPAVFDDLTEVSFFQAKALADEFKLRPVYGFRADSGAVADLLKGSTVMLKGIIPSKPSIGTNLDSVNVRSVRSYFNELQAARDLVGAGMSFIYAPSDLSSPLSGIRQYVRAGVSREAALASMTVLPAQLLGIESQAGTLEPGKLGNVLLTQGDLLDGKSQIMASFIQGKRVDMPMPERKKAEDISADPALQLMKPNFALYPRPAETTVANRLYKNATVWTMGPQGILRNADVLLKDGKIVHVGRGLKAPAGTEVIDATGKHISPGIWDCHSHTGISGSVNEGTNMVTVECRIGDVINHQALNIYQQLSGGTVGANQLHGSANAIGGQSSTVKWRWGMRPTDFPVAGAPPGVKFALGQNPIREDPTGNFGAPTPPVGDTLLTFRPRTRMGVDEAIRRALVAGKEYDQQWQDYRAGKTKIEPRHDLQLEGLAEIATGKRVIHSHGYRSDELLMLVRIAKENGAKIATLQHVLEGYKIADEMKLDGIGGSTFADWWGYKLEAYDAIPYNAALMAERGVSVSINSDSDNHARRLNHEAAKSMRYGGVSAERALSFVTIEPAKQMGIADKTGSLEVGKDADIAIWNTDPTSILAVCLETYVDGVKRFDRADDLRQRAERDAELLEAKKLLAAVASDNPFEGSAPAASSAPETRGGPAVATKTGKSTASFGIGPVRSEPGTMRYARPALLIRGATVHPMFSAPLVGDVLVGANGKIAAVGNNLSANGAHVVNAHGKHLYPGLIDPATGIGLNEIGQVPASDDSSERGNFHPDYRVERAINPEWETMGVARQQGVLTVLVKPNGAGISGQAALINTEGFTWEDLTVQGGVAMTFSTGGGNFNFGSDEDDHIHGDSDTGRFDDSLTSGQGRPSQASGGGRDPYAALTGQLAKARDYISARRAATAENPVDRDLRQEALALVANGSMPVLLNVNSAAEIKAAVEWAEEERIRVVLYGCTGAGEIAEWLAEKQVPIILSAVYQMPRGDQPVDLFYSLPSKLAKAGVRFCLTTNDDKDVRQIRDQAGWAAAYGVDREEAARLITLRAAEVLGISDRLGGIKNGMDGTLILTDGEIIETRTKVLKAWIEGREVDLTNRQTRLYEKYRKRPALQKQ
jgi:imidazolonepropionase-like amidohydrolase